MIVYLNGIYEDRERAKISVYDHSFLYGDGIFETIRVYNKKPFKLNEHIERLKKGARILEIKVPKVDIKKVIQRLLRLNNLADAIVRVTISRGEGKRGIDPALCKKSHVVIIIEEFKGYSDRLYKNGLKAMILNIKRPHPESLPPIKSNNYLVNILGKIEAKKCRMDDGIFLTMDGYVACGITSNIFIVKNDRLITPPLSLGILPGITRETIIEIAKSESISVFERKFKKDILFDADEVFLTSTGYEVMPVKSIDGHLFKRKALTNTLLSLYRALTKG